MKVYHAYFQEYEDRKDIGIFSSEELAKQAIDHWYDSHEFHWFNRKQGYVDEYVIDSYITIKMSPLAKAMEEK